MIWLALPDLPDAGKGPGNKTELAGPYAAFSISHARGISASDASWTMIAMMGIFGVSKKPRVRLSMIHFERNQMYD